MNSTLLTSLKYYIGVYDYRTIRGIVYYFLMYFISPISPVLDSRDIGRTDCRPKRGVA